MKTINIASEQGIRPINNYKEYLNPEYIYIPFDNRDYLLVSIGSRVYMNQEVYKNNDNTLFSTVSGYVRDIVSINKTDYLKIQNDYMEEQKNDTHASNLNVINIDKFIKLLDSDTISDKLKLCNNTLYINAIDDEVFCFNKYMYLKREMKEILNVLNAILRLFNINNIKIVIKNNYSDIQNDYQFNETNISFKVIPGVYPIGNTKLLEKVLVNKDDSLIDLWDIRSIIYKVKKRRLSTTKYLSISGNGIKNSYVFLIKKYSSINDIIEYNDGIVNNSLCGDVKKLKNLIIDDSVNSIIINDERSIVIHDCIKCGLCNSVCPVKINPLVKSDKCIGCGLCNYVCPSKIDIYERYQ